MEETAVPEPGALPEGGVRVCPAGLSAGRVGAFRCGFTALYMETKSSAKTREAA